MAVTIYADPGSHHSTRFTATVDNQAATVLGFARTTDFACLAWSAGATVENSWLTYSASTTAEVVITRLAGAVTSAVIYPKNAGITHEIVGGTLVVQMPVDVRARIEINGDRANVFHLFSDPYSVGSWPAQYTNYTTLRRHVLSVDVNTEIVTTSLDHDFDNGQKIIWHNEAGAVAPTTSPQIEEHMILKVVKLSDTTFTLTTEDNTPITFTNGGSGGRALFPASWNDTANTLLFDTGVWPIARLFDLAVDGLDIYVTGGAIVKGSFNFRNRDNCTIRGSGAISGEFEVYETIEGWDQSDKYPYSIFYGYESPGDQWNHTGNTVEQVTIFATPYYVTRYGINRWDHVKILAAHTWEQDGLAFSGRIAAPHTAEAVKCYVHTSDDNTHLAEQFCQTTVSGCFLIAAHGAVLHAGYFPYAGDTGRSTTVTDCDVMHLGIADLGLPNGYPIKGNNTIIRAWTDGNLGEENEGPNDFHISCIRVWGRMASRLFSIGNTLYPYAPRSGIGQVWDWTIEDITTELAPEQLSYFVSLDAENTPHDITFSGVYLGSTALDEENYSTYIEAWTHPYNIVFPPYVAPILPDAIGPSEVNRKSYGDAVPITPNNVSAFKWPARRLYVGTGGDVSLYLESGRHILLPSVPSGTLIDVSFFRVNSTSPHSTTAGGLVAFF